jgi:hypothetical protein
VIDTTNKRIVGEDWKDKKLNWGYTIICEVAELLDSYNYAWWKKDVYYAANEYLKYKDNDTLSTLITFCGYTVDEVLNKVIEKTALNLLRTNFGYKEGKYIKQWNGKEDNEVATELLKDVDKNNEGDIVDECYTIIGEYYVNKVLNA